MFSPIYRRPPIISSYREFVPINPKEGQYNMSYADIDTNAALLANTNILYQLFHVETPVLATAISLVWHTLTTAASKNAYSIIYTCDAQYQPNGVISAQTTTAITDGGGAATSAWHGGPPRIFQKNTAGHTGFGYLDLALQGSGVYLPVGVYYAGIALPAGMVGGNLAAGAAPIGLMVDNIDTTSATAFASYTFPTPNFSTSLNRSAAAFTGTFADSLTYLHCARR